MKAESNNQVLIVSSIASLMFMLYFTGATTYAQECVSAVIENDGKDNRFVQLRLSSSEDCVSVYGLYVQLERNGSIQVTSAPLDWTYGEVENAAFWTTETEPINSDSKIFGMKLQAQNPSTLRWIALDQTLSPIAEGILVDE